MSVLKLEYREETKGNKLFIAINFSSIHDSAIILLFQLIHVFRSRASVFIVESIKLLKRYHVAVINSCFPYQRREGGT